MNQNQLLEIGKKLLKEKNIDEAELKAKKLLEFVLKQSRSEFIRNSLMEVPDSNKEEYEKMLEQIIQGKPLQYITNHQEFMGLDFYVDENVLIPQPDTEIIIEETIKIIKQIMKNEVKYKKVKNSKNKIKILDLCTGSGAIAVSIAKYIQEELDKLQTKELKYEKEEIQIIGSDISDKALKIAEKNAINNSVMVQYIKSDMFKGLSNYKFDVIVSNPPYIETEVIKTLSKEVQNEPIIALNGGEDGLDFYRTILINSANYLEENGYVLFEIGYNQGKKISDLWKTLKDENKCDLDIITKEPIKDLAGNNRVIILKK